MWYRAVRLLTSLEYPREWLDCVPVVVFACLLPGELRIMLHPGVGMADGDAPCDVPMRVIPPELYFARHGMAHGGGMS